MTDQEIVLAAKPYSMTAGNNLLATVDAVRLIDCGIPGDIVECGVWQGGHIIAAMLASHTARTYWLFDTFDGMTEPGEHDWRKGKHATEKKGYRRGRQQWCRAEQDEVAANVKQYQRADQEVRYVVGPVEKTLRQEHLPDRIVVLRLDTDFYESTCVELEVLWPRLVPGGVLIVDDYYSWDGCRRACDEYFGLTAKFELVYGPTVRMRKP